MSKQQQKTSCSFHVIRCKVILFSVGVLLILSGASCKRSKPAPPPPEVEVAAVTQKDVPIRHEWVATLDGLVNAVIRPEVSGYLIKQNYREGEQVRKGQVMFEIDPRPFQAAVDQAQGSLTQFEAQYENAKANLARVEPLAAQNALSKKDLDNATATLRSAEAQVVAAKAALKTARLNLGFTKIKSPINGIAGIAQAQVGNLVGPSQTGQLTAVSTIDPIKANFTVGEKDYIDFIKLSSSKKGVLSSSSNFEIVLILSDGSLYPHKGKFYATNREIDPKTGTLLVEAVFPNPSLLLRPGQFGRVTVTIGTKKGALLIPGRAVSELQGRFQAAVVGPDNRIEIRNIKPGERLGTLWAIEDGLRPGERVVVEGVQKVKPGMAVNPRPYNPSPSPSPSPSPQPSPTEGRGGKM